MYSTFHITDHREMFLIKLCVAHMREFIFNKKFILNALLRLICISSCLKVFIKLRYDINADIC